MTENVEMWYRNPVACIRELLSNLCFRDHMVYAPRKVFTGEVMADGSPEQEYSEMSTADWWWETQVSSRYFSDNGCH